MADDTVDYGALPFTEQIQFFLRKLNIPTHRWTDVWKDAHDSGFMVAGAYQAQLLQDLRDAVQKAITDGTTLEQFRKDFADIVAEHGWSYNGGFGWRTNVIYETNLRTSYQAGRYVQLTDPELLAERPFWRYVHSDLVKHPRMQHLAWNNLVLPADDPWWRIHFPPNDWGCQCTVYAESLASIARKGYQVAPSAPRVNYVEQTIGERSGNPQTVTVPEGVGPGWDYAPGASQADQVREAVKQTAEQLSDALAAELLAYMQEIPPPPKAPEAT
jgi:uncharacterized protein with gpF-like domain